MLYSTIAHPGSTVQPLRYFLQLKLVFSKVFYRNSNPKYKTMDFYSILGN